jgi:hypothetical protein
MLGTNSKQTVTDFTSGSPLAALLDGKGLELAAWYADPLPLGEARLLHEMAGRMRPACLRRGESCFRLEVLQLVCRYWLEMDDAGLVYRQLASLARCDAEHALLELVYGQLLISRKLPAARRHLECGFSLGARWLNSADYFALVRRHEQLGWLPLMETPARPAPLRILLNEAAVIAQLAGSHRSTSVRSHYDTVG